MKQLYITIFDKISIKLSNHNSRYVNLAKYYVFLTIFSIKVSAVLVPMAAILKGMILLFQNVDTI